MSGWRYWLFLGAVIIGSACSVSSWWSGAQMRAVFARVDQFIKEQVMADYVESVVTKNNRPRTVRTYRRQVDGEWETDAVLESRHEAMCAEMSD